MNTQEQEIFDGLMRQKLGDYSEHPDMGLLEGIHMKKKRVMNIYGIYRLLIICAMVGISAFGSFYLLRSSDEFAGQAGSIEPVSAPVYQAPVVDAHKLHVSNTTPSFLNSTFSFKPSEDNFTSVHLPLCTGFTTNDPSAAVSVTSPVIPDVLKQSGDKETMQPTPGEQLPKNSSATKSTSAPDQKKDATKKEQERKNEKEISSCKAAFDYYVSYDGKIHFSNFSEVSSQASLKWRFGDGQQSNLASPEHKYAGDGSYIVSLEVADKANDCSDVFEKIVMIGDAPEKQTTSIKGTVYAGNTAMASCRVKLIRVIDATHHETVATCSTSAAGQFAFNHITEGNYLLAAHDDANNFITTYWGNVADVDNALEVTVMQHDEDLKGYNIHMLMNKEELSMTGHNSVSTYVDSISTMVLVDANNNPVGSATTDKHGNLKVIGNVPPGEYRMVDAKTGVGSNSLVIPVSGPPVKTPGGNNPETGAMAGNPASKSTEALTFSPNPALNNCNFSLLLSGEETVEITVVNTSGVIIFSRLQSCVKGVNAMNVDVAGLRAGRYFVMVRTANGTMHSGQLIKEDAGFKE